MTNLKPQTVKITDLMTDPANVRTHGSDNLTAISNSLQTFGQRRALVCARGNAGELVVIAGNGTLEAAKSLGWTNIEITEVPEDWDADKAKAYAIADNRTAELADWDQVGLESALLELDAVGYEPQLLGFDIEMNPAIEEEKPRSITVTVECDSEAHREQVKTELEDYGYRVK